MQIKRRCKRVYLALFGGILFIFLLQSSEFLRRRDGLFKPRYLYSGGENEITKGLSTNLSNFESDKHPPPLRANVSRGKSQKYFFLDKLQGKVTHAELKNNLLSPSPPLVIISSVRLAYMTRLLESLPRVNTSRRLMMVDARSSDIRDLEKLKRLAAKHSFEVNVINAHVTKPRTSAGAKDAWYRMIDSAFSILGQCDVLFLEDDIVVAPDAIDVARFLFSVKLKNNDVHAISLGGWSGEHLVNVNPRTVVIRRSKHFQAMAYGFNESFFRSIKKRRDMGVADFLGIQDWTVELPFLLNGARISSKKKFKKGLLYLAVPTMGRMHHLGKFGLGQNGRGSVRNNIKHLPPWAPFSKFSDIGAYQLLPQRRDLFGFTCKPLLEICPCSEKVFHVHLRMKFNPEPKPEHCDDATFFMCSENDDAYDERCCDGGHTLCDRCDCGRKKCCL